MLNFLFDQGGVGPAQSATSSMAAGTHRLIAGVRASDLGDGPSVLLGDGEPAHEVHVVDRDLGADADLDTLLECRR